MNYHLDFLKIYNEGFTKIKKDFIKYLKENTEADETFPVIFDRYSYKLMDIQRGQYQKDKNLINCYENFFFRYDKYKKNAVKNIINQDFYEYFKDEKKRDSEGILDFTTFIQSLAILTVYRNIEKRIHSDYEIIKTAFLEKKFSKILDFKKHEDGEYLIYDKLPIEEDTKQIVSNKLIEDKIPEKISTIIIDDDEKLLLLHLLFICNRNPDFNLKEVEFLSVLKVTKDVHRNRELTDFYGTDYKKLKGGMNYYKGDSSRTKKMLDHIFKICDHYKFKIIKDYIRSIYPK